jgi:hypothetical protein
VQGLEETTPKVLVDSLQAKAILDEGMCEIRDDKTLE